MCWMRVLSTTMVLVKWVVALKPWCVGHHCVVIQSHHHHPTMCVCTMMCVDWGVWRSVHDQWCVCCGWRRLVALVVGCMALLSASMLLCHSTQMAHTVHAHFLFHNTTWMARGPGDLPSCIGWLFCDHSFSLSNHNSLFFLKPSFLLASSSSRMLGDDLLDAFDGPSKRLFLFHPIPVVYGLSASILWCLDGTAFLLPHYLCNVIWCMIRTSRCVISRL